MKLFRDRNGTETTAGYGWNTKGIGGILQITQAQMQERVLEGRPGRRNARIKFTQTSVDSSGNTIKQFYYNPISDGIFEQFAGNGGLASLLTNWDFSIQGPQIIYTYGGPQNFQTSPWFFVPTNGTTTTMDPILKIWSMYTYSGWVGMKWVQSRKQWVQWCQRWRSDPPNGFENPPVTLDADDVTVGIQRLLDNGNPPCLAHPEHIAQDDKPLNAGDYQYSII